MNFFSISQEEIDQNSHLFPEEFRRTVSFIHLCLKLPVEVQHMSRKIHKLYLQLSGFSQNERASVIITRI